MGQAAGRLAGRAVRAPAVAASGMSSRDEERHRALRLSRHLDARSGTAAMSNALEMVLRCREYQTDETYIVACGTTNAAMDQEDARYIAEHSAVQERLPEPAVTGYIP